MDQKRSFGEPPWWGMCPPFIFKCPITDQNVQGWLDADEEAPETEYEGVPCLACTRLHLVNRKTGKLLGSDSK